MMIYGCASETFFFWSTIVIIENGHTNVILQIVNKHVHTLLSFACLFIYFWNIFSSSLSLHFCFLTAHNYADLENYLHIRTQRIFILYPGVCSVCAC